MPTPATLNLTWTSNYVLGCHRIAYRIQGSGDPYTIVLSTDNILNCPSGLLVACSYNISISVENETCDTVTYEGYIQPCCEDILSLDGRIAWTITYNPTPSCLAVDFICNNVGIASVSVNAAGSGYTPGTYTAVITGGGGVGADIDITIDGSGNAVDPVVVVLPGSGYTSTPIVSLPPSACGGLCSSATFTVVMELCPDFPLTDTCDNADAGITIETLLGSSFSVCYTGGLTGAPVPPTNYITLEDPALCCYDCVILQIQPPVSALLTATSMYIDCTTGQLTTVALTNVSGSINTCAKRNSWTSDSVETIFVQGPVCTS